MTEVENTAGENAISKSGRQLPLPLLIAGAIAGVVLLLSLYLPLFYLLVYTWVTNSDYSHCILVPFFSAYLLYRKRDQLRQAADEPVFSGRLQWMIPIAAAFLLRLVVVVQDSPWLGGISFLLMLTGLVTLKWGRDVVRLARPAIGFLIFMFPLPLFLGNLFNAFQYVIVTFFGTYALQTLGVPAISAENLILLTNGQIDVTQGGRGLYLFLTLGVGACLIFNRMRIEKTIILISVVPICIVANTIGIIIAGLAYEFLDPVTAQQIYTDVVGWALLPLGLVLLYGVFWILNRLFVPDD